MTSASLDVRVPASSPANPGISADLRIHSTWQDVELEARWNARAAGGDGGICSTHAWVRAWADALGPEVELCIAERCGVLAPLVVAAGEWGTGRWVRFAGEALVSGDHLQILGEPEGEEVAASLVLDVLADQRVGADGAMLMAVDADSRLLPHLARGAASRRLAVRVRDCGVAPLAILPASMAEFETGLSANMRYHVRRRRRQFERMPGAEVRVVREPADVGPLLAAFFDLHAKRWAAEGQGGLYADARRRMFLERFCMVAAQRGWLRGFELRVQGESLGVLIAFFCRGVASYYQMGWKPDADVDSPGVVLLDASIRAAIDEGLRCYDFMRGAEEYKSRWTREVRRMACVQIGCTTRGRLAVQVDAMASKLKKALRRRVRAGDGPP